MGCCGGKHVKRCCLCSQGDTKWFPWGEKRKICCACKRKQEALIVEREKLNKRARRLMDGVGE